MEDKFEQCSERSTSSSESRSLSTSNQEVPDDLKDKNQQHSEARKLGATPSSLDLPKINLADFDKWESVVNQCGPKVQDQCSPPPEAQVCAPPSPKPADTATCGDNPSTLPPEQQVCRDGDNKAPDTSNESDKATTVIKDDLGRVVREKSDSGKDVVVAYDDKGEPHKFPNEAIKQMPPDFSQIPDWRQKQLDKESDEMLNRYAGGKTAGESEKLDFQKIADMQKEIGQRQDLTETEKCQLYTKIQNTMQEKGIYVDSFNEKKEMIDSWSGERDPWHAIAPLDDKYHNRLLKLSPEEATRQIHEQEDSTEGDMHPTWAGRTAWKIARLTLGINNGDVNASEGQLKAMRALKEKGTFSAYADEWEKQFVVKGASDGKGGTI